MENCPLDSEEETSTNNTFVWMSKMNAAHKQYVKVEGILMSKVVLVICVVGIIGNFLNLLVLSTRSVKMAISAKMGLISLAMSDLCFCFTALLHCFIDRNAFEHNSLNFWLLYDLHGAIFINIFVMTSSWLTAAIALSRYVNVCNPRRFSDRFHRYLTFNKYTVVNIFISSALMNFPRFWKNLADSIERQDCKGHYYYFSQIGPLSFERETIYLCFYLVIAIVLPLVILTFCTVNLILTLRASSYQHDVASIRRNLVTRTLTVMVISYIVLVTPAEILSFIKHFIILNMEWEQSDLYNMVVAIFNTMQALNFGFNFVLYCIINVCFRQALVSLFKCKKK